MRSFVQYKVNKLEINKNFKNLEGSRDCKKNKETGAS